MTQSNTVIFEWDENKNLININKHGLSFKEVESIFYDEHAVIFSDEGHSKYEDRFIIIGMSEFKNVCTVCHCYRENKDGKETIRIISARKATKKETESYKRGL